MPNFGDARASSIPIEFGWGDKLAPRLGFTYDPFSDGRTKIYGSWGQVLRRHEVRVAARLVRRRQAGSTTSSPGTTPMSSVNSASGCATGTNTVVRAAGLPRWHVHRGVRPAPQRCSEPRPVRRSEPQADGGAGAPARRDRGVQLGRPMGNVVLGARYIHKDLKRTIEDVGVTVPGIGTQVLHGQPGRRHHALTLERSEHPAVPESQAHVRRPRTDDGAPLRGKLGPVRQLHAKPPVWQLLRAGEL